MPTEASRPVWSLVLDEVYGSLKSGPDGLGSADASARLASQPAEGPKHNRPLALLASQFKSPIVLLLIGAAIVSGFLGDASDAAIVGAIVLASGLLSFRQEFAAGKAVEELLALVATKIKLLRDGKEKDVPVEQAVPGDVQVLSAGALIAGDGIVIESNGLQVNQSALTGESLPVEKSPGVCSADTSLAERTNAVFKGTFVSSGTGRVLLSGTGAETELGQVMRHMRASRGEGSFHRGIREYGTFLVEMTFVLTIFVFGVNVFFHRPVVESFLFSVALAVGLAPQLLPAVMSVTLAQGSRYLAKAKVIAKRLEAIEEFGSMDVLCSDKTGTLTVGTVIVRGALDPAQAPSESVLRLAGLTAFAQQGLTNSIDQALLADFPHGAFEGVNRLGEVPYDFSRKRLSVAVEEGGAPELVTKGALDSVLSVCDRVATSNGPQPLTASGRADVQSAFQAMSERGVRVLGVASKPLPSVPSRFEPRIEESLVFQGFLLLEDPLRPDSAATVARLHSQGVRLRLITGDNRHIAAQVGSAVGLRADRMLTGSDVRALNDVALLRKARSTDIYSEVDPMDKERIIVALKRTGHTVGYIGDGINDGPAIRAADAGISVSSAADVAREAADFVMLEPGLAVLCEAVIVGRKIFANTLKYVFVTTSASFGNMFSMAAASLFLPFLPLLPKQILLTNFLTDVPAISIASDRVDDEMVQKPRRWHIKSVRDFMLVFGLVSSFFDLVTFAVLLWILHASPEQFRTGWFVESVISEIAILLIMRTKRPLYGSRPGTAMLWSSLGVVLLCAALPYLPGVGVFGFVPLPAVYPLAMSGVLALYAGTNEFAKRAFFRRHGFL